MDKAPAYGAGDSGFESQYGLSNFFVLVFLLVYFFLTTTLVVGRRTREERGKGEGRERERGRKLQPCSDEHVHSFKQKSRSQKKG